MIFCTSASVSPVSATSSTTSAADPDIASVSSSGGSTTGSRQPLVDTRVELDVQRADRLGAERVGDRPPGGSAPRATAMTTSGTNPSSTTACASSRAAVPNRSQLSTSRAGSVVVAGSLGRAGRRRVACTLVPVTTTPVPSSTSTARLMDSAPGHHRPRCAHGRTATLGLAVPDGRRRCGRSSGRRSRDNFWPTACPATGRRGRRGLPRGVRHAHDQRQRRVRRDLRGRSTSCAPRACCSAVATSKPEVFARPICDAFGLTALASTACSAPRSTRAARQGGRRRGGAGRVPRRRCRVVMVGDREHDVHGARAHGVETVGVTGATRPRASSRPPARVERRRRRRELTSRVSCARRSPTTA